MKLLIVDDERLSRSELKFLIREEINDVTFVEADSVESAIALLENVSVDGAFLDIELPDGDGLQIGRYLLEKQDGLVPVAYATAYDQYAIDAFSVSAVDYVMKPFRKEDVVRALNKMVRRQNLSVANVCSSEKLTVSTHDKVVVLNIPEIVYIAPRDRHSVVFTKKGEFTTHQSLDQLEERLKECGFMRVQRSYIVNLNSITEIVPWFNNTYGVKMAGFASHVIPVSRQKVGQLKKIFGF